LIQFFTLDSHSRHIIINKIRILIKKTFFAAITVAVQARTLPANDFSSSLNNKWFLIIIILHLTRSINWSTFRVYGTLANVPTAVDGCVPVVGSIKRSQCSETSSISWKYHKKSQLTRSAVDDVILRPKRHPQSIGRHLATT
jgi:hypothetical protein